MLRTRLWVGAVLIALTVGVLVLDSYLAPWFPFLFALVLSVGLFSCFEVVSLLPAPRRPPLWPCCASVIALLAANWPAHVGWWPESDPWRWPACVFAAVVLAAFLAEMAAFREPGESVTRIALTVWVA